MCEKHQAGGCREDGSPSENERICPEKIAADRAELEEKLQAAESMVEALRQEGLRVKADFMNYRARIERDSARMRALAAESAVMNLIPVLDNLDRAIDSAETLQGEALLEGVQMVRSQFFAALQSMGLGEIPARGEAFNPEVHEAILVSHVEEPTEDGKVLEVLQKGYRLGDRLVRPAKVRVGRYDG